VGLLTGALSCEWYSAPSGIAESLEPPPHQNTADWPQPSGGKARQKNQLSFEAEGGVGSLFFLPRLVFAAPCRCGETQSTPVELLRVLLIKRLAVLTLQITIPLTPRDCCSKYSPNASYNETCR